MKRLNRKGFTLVELLAVIIILAIVVGITIPAVLTTTQKAKEKAFQAAADSAADWFERQYQVALSGVNGIGVTLDTNFETACGSTGATCNSATSFTSSANAALFAAAGLKTSNVESMTVTISASTGRSCVVLNAAADGDYAGAGNVAGNANQVKSSNCA